MARINHYSNIDIIQEMFTDAKKKEILHLLINQGNVFGDEIEIKNRMLKNFGTCGYMGLEKDERVIARAVEYTKKYGVQYSLSRAYASTEINEELERQISKIYDKPVIVYPSTSKAHISIIPIVVASEDAVILDQQVHLSVQTAVQLLRQKGTYIDMIRHSHLEMLERKILELGDKYRKIWYMIDGIYSMYGDTAPMKEIVALMDKYPQLHVYIDDAHGMSWDGKNGGGFVFGEVGIHAKMILATTLAKGFGAVGGIGIFPNEEIWWNVRVWGGPLTYSHPLTPPLLGASLALTEIHLSDEIYLLQNQVKDRIRYCHESLVNKGLPVLSEPNTPIKFVGAGKPETGYNMIKGVMDDGFFVNIGLFPGVPIKCTGLRFTITRHQKYEDIDALVESIHRNYIRTLCEEQITDSHVRKAFKLPVREEHEVKNVNYYTSINQLNKVEWNHLFEKEGSFDYEGMQYLEKVYSNNPEKHNNWKFFYFIKRDQNQKIKLATFFTLGVYKDDFLSLENISKQIEEKRKSDPYYLTSCTLAMGSMLTLGNHLYLDRNDSNWKIYLKELLDDIEILREQEKADNILLRDFYSKDQEMAALFGEKGFVKIEMPLANIANIEKWSNEEEFLTALSSSDRKHVKKEVFRNIDLYEVEYKKELTDKEIDQVYNLFLNVSAKNFAINIFPYPKKSIQMMNSFDNWEFVILRLRDEPEKIAAAVMCYIGNERYNPLFVGMDYDCKEKKLYKQILYQVVFRAKKLKLKDVVLGFTADTDKKKMGSEQIKTCAYMQAHDNYNMEVIASMGNIN